MAQAEQDQLTRQVGRALLGVAGADWQQVRAEYRAAGRHVEVDVIVKGPDGAERGVRPPQEVVEGFGRLRQGMYRPGRGTWLSALYVLDPPSAFNAEFEPDVEPRWRRVPPPIGFADELRFYPRADEHIPEWLRQRAGLPLPRTRPTRAAHRAPPDQPARRHGQARQQDRAGRARLAQAGSRQAERAGRQGRVEHQDQAGSRRRRSAGRTRPAHPGHREHQHPRQESPPPRSVAREAHPRAHREASPHRRQVSGRLQQASRPDGSHHRTRPAASQAHPAASTPHHARYPTPPHHPESPPARHRAPSTTPSRTTAGGHPHADQHQTHESPVRSGSLERVESFAFLCSKSVKTVIQANQKLRTATKDPYNTE